MVSFLFFFCVFLPVLDYDLVDTNFLLEYRTRTEKKWNKEKNKKDFGTCVGRKKRKQKERKMDTQRDIIWDICFFSGATKAEEK